MYERSDIELPICNESNREHELPSLILPTTEKPLAKRAKRLKEMLDPIKT
jgi:hypothetical protein